MRPSAGTLYFARVPEILVSPQAPQDRDRATSIASPLRTPEPKADAANHATRVAPALARIHTVTSGMPGHGDIRGTNAAIDRKQPQKGATRT